MRFETSNEIAAPAAVVWRTLVDIERWPGWGAGIERVDGTLGDGGEVVLHVAGQSRPFELPVVDWRPERRFQFRSGMPLGLFTGTRTYELDPITGPDDQAGGATRFHLVEVFGGPLAPLIGRTIPDLQPSFDAFAAGLRQAAEADATTRPER